MQDFAFPTLEPTAGFETIGAPAPEVPQIDLEAEAQAARAAGHEAGFQLVRARPAVAQAEIAVGHLEPMAGADIGAVLRQEPAVEAVRAGGGIGLHPREGHDAALGRDTAQAGGRARSRGRPGRRRFELLHHRLDAAAVDAADSTNTHRFLRLSKEGLACHLFQAVRISVPRQLPPLKKRGKFPLFQGLNVALRLHNLA